MADKHRNALSKGYEIEGYRIESVLGSGGFGITYRALEIEICRKVAIKEYLPSGRATRDNSRQSVEPLSDSDRQEFKFGLESFRQEAKTLVSFRHPNIVSVLRFFSGNGTAYLVMEYEAGESLYAILARHKILSEDEIRGILFPLLDGLEKVHEAGFLHRDIKPGNIYIRKDGSPVLLDFGSARHALGQKSQSLTTIVTRGYAPFEQYASRGNQGPWSDIYALGAVLYRAVTGHRPPDAPDRMVEDTLVATGTAAQALCSENLLSAIDSALLIEPKDRPQSVAAWRAMIEATTPVAKPTPKPAASLAGEPVEKSPAQAPALPADTGASAGRAGAWRAGVLAAILVFAIAGAGIWGWSKYQASRERAAQLATQLAAKAKAEAAETARLEAARVQAEQGRQREAEAKRQAEVSRRAEIKRRAAEASRQTEIKRQTKNKRQAEEARVRSAAAARRRAGELRRRRAARGGDRAGQAGTAPRKRVSVATGGRRFAGVYPAAAAAWASRWPTGRAALWRDKTGDNGGLTPVRSQENSSGEVCRRIRWWSVLSGRRVTGENFYCRKSNGIIALRPRY